jgi:hypothetical protein
MKNMTNQSESIFKSSRKRKIRQRKFCKPAVVCWLVGIVAAVVVEIASPELGDALAVSALELRLVVARFD